MAAALLLAPHAHAQKIVLKVATVAPEGSVWHRGIQELAERWKRDSGGLVTLKVFAGGIAGDETDMIRKLRSGQLQGAALSAVGLHDIDLAPQLLTLPGLSQSPAEWEALFARALPDLDARLSAKGFIALNWADLGSVCLFLKHGGRTTADLRGVKVFAWSGDPSAVEAWRIAGFQPVVGSVSDLTTALTTGLVEAFAATPALALGTRWFERAPAMLATPWGHLPGSTVLTREAWERIPAALRPKLLASARELGARVDRAAVRQYDEAVAEMGRRGLRTFTFSDSEQKTWDGLLRKAWKPLLANPEAKALLDSWLDQRNASGVAGSK